MTAAKRIPGDKFGTIWVSKRDPAKKVMILSEGPCEAYPDPIRGGRPTPDWPCFEYGKGPMYGAFPVVVTFDLFYEEFTEADEEQTV